MHCKRMNYMYIDIYLLPHSYAPDQLEDGWGWEGAEMS